MAKSEFRSVESMGNIMQGRFNIVKTWDKKDALAIMMPQRVEDNKLYNFRNDVIGGCDGKDIVFHEDESIITETTRITDKFLNAFYAPMEAYFGETTSDNEDEDDNSEPDDVYTVDEEKPKKNKKNADDLSLISEIQDLIEKDDLKAAKKLLKANPDHGDFKKAKKLIKKAKGE